MDLQSGADLLESLQRLGYRATLVHADDDLDLTLRQSDVDACLLALHGTIGGAGDVQSLLAMRGMPFAGPDAATIAFAFDKVRARQLLAYHNLPVPASVALSQDTDVSQRALDLLGWPCVLKPRRGALGVGVTHLSHRDQVADALDRALSLDHELVLERSIEGAEIQVVLLGDRVLGAMQVDRGGVGDDSIEIESTMMCPPPIGRGRLSNIGNLARRAVTALGLQDHICRVDILLSSRQNEVILEVEPNPPLHRDGVVARVARAAGFRHERLVAELLDRVTLAAAHERGAELQPHVMQ